MRTVWYVVDTSKKPFMPVHRAYTKDSCYGYTIKCGLGAVPVGSPVSDVVETIKHLEIRRFRMGSNGERGMKARMEE